MAAKRKKLDKAPEKSNYGFIPPNKDLEFIHTGCDLLDLVLGGGYPIGRVSNVVGDSSTNKCIAHAYVIDNNKGMVNVDEFGSSMPYGYTDYVCNLNIDNNTTAETSHFWKQEVEKTIRIETRHGFNLEGTYEHPIIVWNEDCTFSFKQLKDLKIGDVAVLVKGLNSFSETNKQIDFKAHNSANAKDVTIPKEMCEELATILGYFVADGNFKNNSLRISNSRAFVFDNLNKNLGVIGLSYNKGSIYSVVLTNLFKEFFGSPERFIAADKFIPKHVIDSTREVNIAFIKALFDCGAYFSDGSIIYTTASKKLAEQVQLVLLNLGILSTKKELGGSYIGDKYYDKKYYTISLYASDVYNYHNIVGSLKFKYDKGKELPTRHSDFDSIPFLLQRMKKDISSIRDMVGWSRNGLMSDKEGRFPHIKPTTLSSGNATYYFIKDFCGKLSNFSEYFNLDFYQMLLKNEYHFDFITKIEKLENKVDVYDFHIPTYHMFWSNGFISHNTGLTIEAMANFRKQYPEGLIWYHDAEAAFDIDYAIRLGLPEDKNTEVITSVNGVEDAYEKIQEALRKVTAKKTRGIYVLDTLDALQPVPEDDTKDPIAKGYDNAKRAALINSFITKITPKVEQANLHLMVVSQIRDNIGVMIGDKHRVAGGSAFKFYATHRIWLTMVKQLTKTVRGVKNAYGIQVQANCKKNKISVPFRKCIFPVYFFHGIVNDLANVQYLLSVSDSLNGFGMTKEELKNAEITKELSKKLTAQVKKVWYELEKEFIVGGSKY